MEDVFDPSIMRTRLAEQEALRDSVVKSTWAITGYVWDVIRNLIVSMIVLYVYSNVYSDTQLLFSVLLIIYLSVVSVGAGLGQYNVRMSLFNIRLHLKTQTILLSRADESSVARENLADEENEVRIAEYEADKLRYKFYINGTFISVLYVMAVYNLLTAL
ncbi:hypothetical protein HYV30_03995 [Candidatus Kaiserbacteria bacterium]|nr:hypothetical protein [Candidatus Kaiserbacteria bacterium]